MSRPPPHDAGAAVLVGVLFICHGVLFAKFVIATYFVAAKSGLPDVLRVAISQFTALTSLVAFQQIGRHVGKWGYLRDIKRRRKEREPLQGMKEKGDTYGNT